MSEEIQPTEDSHEAAIEQPAEKPTGAKIAPVEISQQQIYFFPEGEFSCEAPSLEDAIKRYEQHQKGARKSA